MSRSSITADVAHVTPEVTEGNIVMYDEIGMNANEISLTKNSAYSSTNRNN